jgi:ubiquinone/menaquinone biosynthesis C-methylase UbiE
MRWLERSPRTYDRGIQLLTLGRLRPLKRRIVERYIRPGCDVLEIGCGTGELALMMAKAGAQVTGVDISNDMLAVARERYDRSAIEGGVKLRQLEASTIEDHFDPASFDLIVSTLVFSELPIELQFSILQSAHKLLRHDGRFVLLDEFLPSRFVPRLIYRLVRLPVLFFTWLLTRTTTSPLKGIDEVFKQAQFAPDVARSELAGSLLLVEGTPLAEEHLLVLEREFPRLRHTANFRTALLDFLSFTNRILPPYLKQRTGLYRIGSPDARSPLLVTGNYELTVRRLTRELDGNVDCWLLVANSRGINVWCAAGGGHFTAEDVISALRTSGADQVVSHHALVLPQLCANGVDGWKIRDETAWGVHWGPARAEDIPAYLESGRQKTDAMRKVSFPLPDRLEMTTAILTFYGLLLGIISFFLWKDQLLIILGFMVVASYIYGVFLPWIPGRDGLEKGVSLAAITLLAIWGNSLVDGEVPANMLFNRSLGYGFLAFFIGAEFQGMSPRMRGEQANWSIGILVGVATLVLYGIGRVLLGG